MGVSSFEDTDDPCLWFFEERHDLYKPSPWLPLRGVFCGSFPNPGDPFFAENQEGLSTLSAVLLIGRPLGRRACAHSKPPGQEQQDPARRTASPAPGKSVCVCVWASFCQWLVGSVKKFPACPYGRDMGGHKVSHREQGTL